jgi:hypothetical protein
MGEIESMGEIQSTRENFHQKYFIGIHKYIPDENILLLINRVLPTTFFKYPIDVIYKYFFWYSGIYINMNPRPPPIEIIQVYVLADDTYTCVLKTYYIKIIQRRWKKIYRERKQYILERSSLKNLWNYSIGKRTCKNSFSGIKGLLSDFSK